MSTIDCFNVHDLMPYQIIYLTDHVFYGVYDWSTGKMNVFASKDAASILNLYPNSYLWTQKGVLWGQIWFEDNTFELFAEDNEDMRDSYEFLLKGEPSSFDFLFNEDESEYRDTGANLALELEQSLYSTDGLTDFYEQIDPPVGAEPDVQGTDLAVDATYCNFPTEQIAPHLYEDIPGQISSQSFYVYPENKDGGLACPEFETKHPEFGIDITAPASTESVELYSYGDIFKYSVNDNEYPACGEYNDPPAGAAPDVQGTEFAVDATYCDFPTEQISSRLYGENIEQISSQPFHVYPENVDNGIVSPDFETKHTESGIDVTASARAESVEVYRYGDIFNCSANGDEHRTCGDYDSPPAVAAPDVQGTEFAVDATYCDFPTEPIASRLYGETLEQINSQAFYETYPENADNGTASHEFETLHPEFGTDEATYTTSKPPANTSVAYGYIVNCSENGDEYHACREYDIQNTILTTHHTNDLVPADETNTSIHLYDHAKVDQEQTNPHVAADYSGIVSSAAGHLETQHGFAKDLTNAAIPDVASTSKEMEFKFDFEAGSRNKLAQYASEAPPSKRRRLQAENTPVHVPAVQRPQQISQPVPHWPWTNQLICSYRDDVCFFSASNKKQMWWHLRDYHRILPYARPGTAAEAARLRARCCWGSCSSVLQGSSMKKHIEKHIAPAFSYYTCGKCGQQIYVSHKAEHEKGGCPSLVL